MVKKRYNWKSRQVVNTVVDDSATKKVFSLIYKVCHNNKILLFQIQLDLPVEGHYDQSNELVLPSKKRKTKVKDEKNKVVKILSKKHRKKLEKIVEKKKKKENVSSHLVPNSPTT